MFENSLFELLSTVRSILIFFILIFSLIVSIVGLLFCTLSIILFVVGIILAILYVTIYNNKKLKLMLAKQITDLEVFFLVGIWSLIYLGVIFLTLKLLKFWMLYIILVRLYILI